MRSAKTCSSAASNSSARRSVILLCRPWEWSTITIQPAIVTVRFNQRRFNLKRKLLLLTAVAVLALAPKAFAQNPQAALANLPEADALIYVSPQRILNEAAPRVMDPAELAKARATFTDMKKGAGIDPSSIEYLVIAVRFNKPAADLSFVAPDVMAVVGGDFSSDSLMTLGQLYLQDKLRVEKYGSKSIALMKVDPIAAQAEKNPILKP